MEIMLISYHRKKIETLKQLSMTVNNDFLKSYH